MAPVAQVAAAQAGSNLILFMPFMELHAIECFQSRLPVGFGPAHIRVATTALFRRAMDAAPFPVVARGARPDNGTPSHVPPLWYVNH